MLHCHPNNWNFDEPMELMEPTEEILNPSVACGFSQETDEYHAPPGLTDPFTCGTMKSA